MPPFLMTTTGLSYETYRVEMPDHRVGTVEVYAGVVVQVSATLVDLLGQPWAEEVYPQVLKAREVTLS